MNTSLPFKINNVYEGFAVTEGILRLNNDSLVFEFMTKDAILGIIKTDVKNVIVQFDDIAEINFKKNMFGNSLFIRLSSLMKAQELPGSEGSQVELDISKKNTDIALSFVSNIQIDMSHIRFKNSEERYKEELSRAIDDA